MSAVPVDLQTADAVLVSRNCVVMGFDAYANGAAVVFYLRELAADGVTPAGGQPAIAVSLASGASTGDWYADCGKLFKNGVYLDIISNGANLVGSIWVN